MWSIISKSNSLAQSHLIQPIPVGQCSRSLIRVMAEAPLGQLCLHPKTAGYTCYCTRPTVATDQGNPAGRGDSMSDVPSAKFLHMPPVLLQGQCLRCPATHSPCDTILLGAGLATALGGLAGTVTMSSAQLPSCCGNCQD